MDIARSLMYAFDDPDKIKKILIGGILRIIPIVGWISDGYALVQTKSIYEGRELPLPEWSDMGAYFKKGMMAFLGGLIYAIPVILIACCMWAVAFLPTMSSGGSSDLSGPAMLIVTCGGCLLALYGLVLLILIPALTTRYAITEQFNVFFQVQPAWQLINSNLSGYVMAIVVLLVAGVVGGLLSSITCGLGTPFAGFWTSLVAAYLFGNFAKGAPSA
jgi:hypothetical protein